MTQVKKKKTPPPPPQKKQQPHNEPIPSSSRNLTDSVWCTIFRHLRQHLTLDPKHKHLLTTQLNVTEITTNLCWWVLWRSRHLNRFLILFNLCTTEEAGACVDSWSFSTSEETDAWTDSLSISTSEEVDTWTNSWSFSTSEEADAWTDSWSISTSEEADAWIVSWPFSTSQHCRQVGI